MLGYYDIELQLPSQHRRPRRAGAAGDAHGAAIHPRRPAAAASESRFAALYKTESRITRQPDAAGQRLHHRASWTLSPRPASSPNRSPRCKMLATAQHGAARAPVRRARRHSAAIATTPGCSASSTEHIVSQRARSGRGDNDQRHARPVPRRLRVGRGSEAVDDAADAGTAPAGPGQATFAARQPLMTDPPDGGYIHAPSHPARATPPRCCAAATSPTPTHGQSRDAGGQSVVRSRPCRAVAASKASATDRASARCSATGSSAACTTITGSPRSTSSSTRCARRSRSSLTRSTSTKTRPDVPIEAIEARNVLDGKKLVDSDPGERHQGVPVRPDGAARRDDARGAGRAQRADDRAARRLRRRSPIWRSPKASIRPCRATTTASASTLDAYTTGNFPPEPEVVQTPPAGIGLTHRVALQLKPGLAAPAGATPRAQAEPAVDDWLAAHAAAARQHRLHGRLDRSGQRRRRSSTPSRSPTSDCARSTCSTLLKPDNAQAMTELDDRMLSRRVIATGNPRPDADAADPVLTRRRGAAQHLRDERRCSASCGRS